MSAWILIPGIALIIQVISFVLALRLVRRYSGRLLTSFTLLFGILLTLSIMMKHYWIHTSENPWLHLLPHIIVLLVSCMLLVGAIFVTHMVISLQQTQQAASRAETRYRALLDQSPDGILVLDAAGSILEFNERSCEQLGYTKEEFATLRIPDINPSVSAEEVRDRLEQIALRGRLEIDTNHRTKSGELRNVRIMVRGIKFSGQSYFHAIWRDITAQKRAEERLLASEQTYRTLAENIPGIVYRVTLGPLPATTFFNRMLTVMLGYSAEELATTGPSPLVQVIAPRDRLRVAQEIGFAISTRQPYVVDYQVVHHDGSTRHVAERGTPVFDAHGKAVCLDGIIFDVSQRHQAEESLRASEQRFRDVVAAAGELIWEIDAAARFIYLSDRVHMVTGYHPHELLGSSAAVLLPHDETARLAAVITDLFRSRSCVSGLEMRLCHKDGSDRWLSVSGVPIVDSGVFRGYRGTALDITERKRIAESLEGYRHALEENVAIRTGELQQAIEDLVREINERKAVEQELKKSRLFLQNILNSIQDPIMVLDQHLHILMTNERFARQFANGQDSTTVSGTCHELLCCSSRSCSNCLSRTAMSTGKMTSRTVCHGEPDDEQLWLDICVFPLTDAEGKIIGSVHHMRDITTRKQAEERIDAYQKHLRAFAQQLIRTEERERRKIAQALHDGVPQKIALSRIFLQKAQTFLACNEEVEGLFSRIYGLHDDMAKEVRSLTYELAPPVLYEVGLEPAVERLLANLLDGIPLTWSFENLRSGPPVRGELAPTLYSIIRELVMNVLKYADARTLTITLSQSDGSLRTVVQDDGRGMPAGTARRAQRDPLISGFGLFSIRERLRALDGRMEIKTNDQTGTIVCIEVPFHAATMARSPHA